MFKVQSNNTMQTIIEAVGTARKSTWTALKATQKRTGLPKTDAGTIPACINLLAIESGYTLGQGIPLLDLKKSDCISGKLGAYSAQSGYSTVQQYAREFNQHRDLVYKSRTFESYCKAVAKAPKAPKAKAKAKAPKVSEPKVKTRKQLADFDKKTSKAIDFLVGSYLAEILPHVQKGHRADVERRTAQLIVSLVDKTAVSPQ